MIDKSIELPRYITMLDSSEFSELKKLQLSNLIIACGLHAPSGDIVFMTDDCQLREINMASHFGDFSSDVTVVVPVELGKRICLKSNEKVIYADSEDIINASNSISMNDLEI